MQDISTNAKYIYHYMRLTPTDSNDLDRLAVCSENDAQQLIEKMLNDSQKGHRLIHLVKNKSLHCGTPTGFNDPYDCTVQFSDDMTDENLINMARTLKDNGSASINGAITEIDEDTQASHLCKGLRDRLVDDCRAAMQDNVSKIRIICFSKNNDNSLMWAHYADKHKGICVGFSVNALRPTSFLKAGGFYDVTYCNHRPSITMSASEFSSLRMAYKILLHKSTLWEYEDEVRYINGNDEYMKFNSDAIACVILGAKMSDSNKIGLGKLFQQFNLDIGKVHEASIDRWRYKINIKKMIIRHACATDR